MYLCKNSGKGSAQRVKKKFNVKKNYIMICTCPAGAALPDIPAITCPESFGQIQKVAFQRIYRSTGIKNFFPTMADMKLKANWTSLLTSADGSKVVISPYIEAPTAEAGAAKKFGGGNDTLGGVEEVVGREVTPFEGVIRKAPQSVIKALKGLDCNNLGIYLFDANGTIGAIQGATEGEYYPIPIRTFFVGDKTLGGLEAPDSNKIEWVFLPNWSDSLVRITPTDFNPLTDLVVSI